MNVIFFLTPKTKLEYLYDTNTIRQGLEKIRVKGFTAIPIISKDGKYIGTISEGDFLWYIMNNKKFDIKDLEDTLAINIINKTKYQPVRVNARIEDLYNLIVNQNFVPVIDDRDIFMGIITRKSVIEYYYNQTRERE